MSSELPAFRALAPQPARRAFCSRAPSASRAGRGATAGSDPSPPPVTAQGRAGSRLPPPAPSAGICCLDLLPGSAAWVCCRGMRPPPRLPPRLRAAPAALLPVCAGGRGVPQWRARPPAAASLRGGESPRAVRNPTESGGKHGALPPQRPGTRGSEGAAAQPATARAPTLGAEILCLWLRKQSRSCTSLSVNDSVTKRLHGAPEGHLCCRGRRGAPPGHTRSPPPLLTPAQQPALSTRVPKVLPLLQALPAPRALRGCCRDRVPGRSESRLVEDLPVCFPSHPNSHS